MGKLSALENDGVVVTLKEFKRIKTQYVPAAGDLGEANVFDINSAGSDDGDFSVNEVLMSYLI